MIELLSAVTADAPLLPAIERSSGEAFRALSDLAWIVDDDVQSVSRHLELIDGGWTWVAKSEAAIVGFLSAERFSKSLHIWQMAVHHDFQKMGIGRQLIRTVSAAAKGAGFTELTLTTFRDIAWNEQFYRTCGFETLGASSISIRLRSILEAERNAGLPVKRRCAMSCNLR